MDIIVVSIGTLSKNPLWNERVPVRTSHATSTLIRVDKTAILVDPSLPGEALDARLFERAGIRASDITHVFLTNWRPVHRRGIERFSAAQWLMSDAEISAVSAALDRAEEQAAHQENPELETLVKKERAQLEKIKPAPDDLAGEHGGIQLYPLPGYTEGQCGLILTEPTRTTIITGDAVPTGAHFSTGQVFPDCWDLEKAKESMHELYEIADLVIPGHDNIFIAPRSAGM